MGAPGWGGVGAGQRQKMGPGTVADSWGQDGRGRASHSGAQNLAWVPGLPCPYSCAPWQGWLGSAEARAAVTQNHDLGAVGQAGLGTASHGPPVLPPQSLGVGTCQDPPPAPHQWAPWPSTLVSQSTGAGGRDGMGQLPGARPMGRCLAPASPAAPTGAQALGGCGDSGPGGEPALQTGATQHPHPLDGGEIV